MQKSRLRAAFSVKSAAVFVRFIVHFLFYYGYKKRSHSYRQEVQIMKGYIVNNGYMGYIGGRYQLFASEGDYREYMED